MFPLILDEIAVSLGPGYSIPKEEAAYRNQDNDEDA